MPGSGIGITLTTRPGGVKMQQKKNIEEQAGESLAEIWDDLDRQARAERPDEFAKAQKMFEEWAGKLTDVLARKQK